MHRIDGPGAGPGGTFREGDPAVGTESTIVTDDWANAIQEEIVSVVEGAGLALAKPDTTQLLQAIRILANRVVPVGGVLFGYYVEAEPGFILPMGQLLNRADYPVLLAAMTVRGFIVSEAAWAAGAFGMFGAGDGVSTFRAPRVGGQFPRIVDMGAGVDPLRTVGSLQADANKEHTHGIRADDGGFSGPSQQVSGTDRTFVSYTPQTLPSGGPEARPKNIAWGAMLRVV
jgi:hypothetical protein